jgi:hypothetical protein
MCEDRDRPRLTRPVPLARSPLIPRSKVRRRHAATHPRWLSLPHTKASRCASGTSNAVRCSGRTNHRHQYFIVAARSRLVAGHHAQFRSARRAGRSCFTLGSRFTFRPRFALGSRFTLRPSWTHWARRTRIAFLPCGPGCSFFARRSSLTLRSLRARTGGKQQVQQGDSYRHPFHSFLPFAQPIRHYVISGRNPAPTTKVERTTKPRQLNPPKSVA